jgi:hypothetical protein
MVLMVPHTYSNVHLTNSRQNLSYDSTHRKKKIDEVGEEALVGR